MRYVFFPGSSGPVWGSEAGLFPVGGLLVPGSNFGALETYMDAEGRLRRDSELDGRTTRTG